MTAAAEPGSQEGAGGGCVADSLLGREGTAAWRRPEAEGGVAVWMIWVESGN